MDFISKTTSSNGGSNFSFRLADKTLYLRPVNQSSEVSIDIPDNIGSESEIRIEKLDYTGGNGKEIHSKNSLKEIKERLKNIFCITKNQSCFIFFESLNSVHSFEVLFEKDPNYYQLIYNDNKILICNPINISFDECIEKSKSIQNSKDEKMKTVFEIKDTYNFQEIQIQTKISNHTKLLLKLSTDYGNQFYEINYPTSKPNSKNFFQFKRVYDISLSIKAYGLLALTPIPILLDILVFPYSIYYGLREYGKGFRN
jgi:uncharacterized protein YerC